MRIIGQMGFEEFIKKMRRELGEKYGKNNLQGFWGNQNSKIVSISQAPSILAATHQRPFSDKSGDRLRNSWYQISWDQFYNKDNFYFTTVGLYYPGKNKGGGDKKPDFKEANIWLRQELSYLRPKLFLVVGGVAAEFFFGKKKFEEFVFADQEINNTLAYVLPHPSPINIKWFKDHPEFEEKRLKTIRQTIQKILLG